MLGEQTCTLEDVSIPSSSGMGVGHGKRIVNDNYNAVSIPSSSGMGVGPTGCAKEETLKVSIPSSSGMGVGP